MSTKEGRLFLSQSLYIKNVLGRFKILLPEPGTKLNEAETPMDHRIIFHKNGATYMRFKPKEKDTERDMEKCGAEVPYREVVGSLFCVASQWHQTRYLLYC